MTTRLTSKVEREIRSNRRQFRNLVFNEIYSYYSRYPKKSGLTQKKLADRIGIDYSQLSRLLSAPSNLTLDTIADLLWGMEAELDLKVSPREDRQTPDEYMATYRNPSQDYGFDKVISLDGTREYDRDSDTDTATIGSFQDGQNEAATA